MAASMRSRRNRAIWQVNIPANAALIRINRAAGHSEITVVLLWLNYVMVGLLYCVYRFAYFIVSTACVTFAISSKSNVVVSRSRADVTLFYVKLFRYQLGAHF